MGIGSKRVSDTYSLYLLFVKPEKIISCMATKNVFLLLFCFFYSLPVFSQDAYHNKLQTDFQNNYDLPAGEWVFFDNEDAILNAAGGYGGSFSTLTSSNTDFSKLMRANIPQTGANPWNSGWNIKNQKNIAKDDKILIIFAIRSVSGPGKTTIFAEHAGNFNKEANFTIDVPESWQYFLIPFAASQDFTSQGISFGFHLGFQPQTLEIGGFTAINFGKNVELAALPNEINNDKYEGYEPDAPWRSAAAERIENIRKSQLNIQVKTPDGTPIDDAAVQVKMLRHDFAFGSAITANRIAGNNKFDATYTNKIINLDGKGHGFNWIVFENDLKWPGWENEWQVSHNELVEAVKWVKDQGIEIRGHNLVWPGEKHLPQDINNNKTNLTYIRERINNHLDEILTYPGLQGEIIEWDVLNEITTNRSLEEYFGGREILADIFKKTRELDSETGLWLNDYVTLSLNNKPGAQNYDNLKLFTQELINAGADIEGIGFQGHIGGFPNSIPSVLETLDDFYTEFGLKAKITEFDLPTNIKEELAAQYLADFMTAIFSHESMNGFLFWSFWDGATYMNEGSNLFRMDWSRTPAGDAFIDLVFNQWWTDEVFATSPEGKIETTVFKGLHEISYESEGLLIRDTLNITEDSNFEIIANDITSDLDQISLPLQIAVVYPNPTQSHLFIQSFSTNEITIRIFDLTGRKIMEEASVRGETQLFVGHLKGLFVVEVSDGLQKISQKVLIE